jgi:hypothetical protein
MRTIPLYVHLHDAGRRTTLMNAFRSLVTQIGKSAQRITRIAMVILTGVLFLFGFYLGLTLLALKILL